MRRPGTPGAPHASLGRRRRHRADHRDCRRRPPPRGPPGPRPLAASPVEPGGAGCRAVAGGPGGGRSPAAGGRRRRRDRGTEGRPGNAGDPGAARAIRCRLRGVPRGRVPVRRVEPRPAGAGLARPPRAGPGPGAGGARRAVGASPGPARREDGGPGPPDGRDRARLQQPPLRDHRPGRAGPAPARPRAPGLRPARPGAPGGRARRRAEPPAARLRSRLARGSPPAWTSTRWWRSSTACCSG